MDAFTFIKINQTRILNIDGCLTETANITLSQNGNLVFYYFTDGKLTHSKTNTTKW